MIVKNFSGKSYTLYILKLGDKKSNIAQTLRNLYSRKDIIILKKHNLIILQLNLIFFSIFRFCRMSPERYDHLLSLVHNGLVKKYHIREPISPGERLAVTLRYLATGDSQTSIGFLFKIGRSTICDIIEEVCDEIWRVLSPKYVSSPTSISDWKEIAEEFAETWNMPHCIGALDGKHIRMRKPADSGSLWHNYKGFFSMVLLAICDARYCFSFIDIGEYGSNNDSGVLRNSKMGKMFERNQMNIPEPEVIKGENFKMPYFLVGDEIFPLMNWLMRPYAGSALTDDRRKFLIIGNRGPAVSLKIPLALWLHNGEYSRPL